jgi:hypothetical protein
VDPEKMRAGYKGATGKVHTSNIDGTFCIYNPDLFKGAPSVAGDILDHGSCRVAAFAGNGAAVAIMDDDYYSYQKVPIALGDKIKELVGRGCVINDVWLEDTYQNCDLKRWCLIYNGTHFVTSQYCNGAMVSALRSMENDGERIWSVSCTSEGKYVIIGEKTLSYSTCFESDLMAAKNKYGKIRSAHVINPGKLIICCEDGIYFRNIPSNMADTLQAVSWLPRVAKFNLHGAFFFADGSGSRYQFYM